MAPINRPPQTKFSEQNVFNNSYDTDFDVVAFENLTYNPISNNLERVSSIQGNASLVLSYTSGNITTLQKTVGATTYTKTLTYDASGNLTNVSAWS